MSRCAAILVSLTLAGSALLAAPGTGASAYADISAPVYENTDDTGGELSRAEEELSDIYEQFIETLPDGVAQIGEGLSGGEGILELLGALGEPLAETVREFLKVFLLFFAVSLIMCLGELLTADTELGQTAKGALSIVLSLPVIGAMSELLSSVLDGLNAASSFFSEIMPLLTTTVAIGVGGTTAAASAAGMSITLGLTEGIICKNLYLLFGAVFALSMIGNFDTGQGTASLARGVRSCFNFLLGAVTLILGGTLALQSTLTASRDTLALRGAKYAISGMVPVVGGIVSGSIGTLISGAKLLSAGIGTLGVITIVYYMAAPLISLLLFRLCMGACIVFSSFVGASFGGKFFESVRGAVDCLIAPLASSLIIYILELVIFTVTVSSV